MRQLQRLVVPLLLVVALAAACGGDDGDGVEVGDGGSATSTTLDPDTAVSSPPGTLDGSVPPATWARIEPTDDLASPTVASADEIVPDPDDPNAVLVRFYGGVQECYGARATVIEQGADRVVIRLETGSRSDIAPDTACIEIAEAQELQVVLDAPVADRQLVAADG